MGKIIGRIPSISHHLTGDLLRTIRIEYGQLGKKYVLRTFEGEINGEGGKEALPKEEIFEKEQELMKKVYDRKNVLVGVSWSLRKDLWIIQEENDLFLNHHF